MNKLDAFAKEQLKESVPTFHVGDTIRVHNKIKEGTRERIQMFEGTVVAKRGAGISETFTVGVGGTARASTSVGITSDGLVSEGSTSVGVSPEGLVSEGATSVGVV